MIGEVKLIAYKEAIAFLLPKHYSGRKPVISKAFGWIINNELIAVCTFGKPASNPLCRGLAGDSHSHSIYELNRLCMKDGEGYQISQFVSYCLRRLHCENWIVVAYADTAMKHTGYIYQACNFIYTGLTKRRTDKYTSGNKHCRHYKESEQGSLRKVRSAKHRYIYFCTKDRSLKRQWLCDLKYNIVPYPKTKNEKYILGEFLEPEYIRKVK